MGAAVSRGEQSPACAGLLDLDARARFLQLALDRIGLAFVDAFLDGVRRSIDQVLRFLKPEAGDRADDLDHLDLLVACAGEDDVERRLLLGRTCPIGPRRRGPWGRYRDRCGGGDSPLLLERVLQLDQLEDGHLPELLDDLCGVRCHYCASSSTAVSVPFDSVDSFSTACGSTTGAISA